MFPTTTNGKALTNELTYYFKKRLHRYESDMIPF